MPNFVSIICVRDDFKQVIEKAGQKRIDKKIYLSDLLTTEAVTM